MFGPRGERFGVSGGLALLACHDAQALQLKRSPQLAHECVMDDIFLAASVVSAATRRMPRTARS